MAKVRKAVIPIAGLGTRFLPQAKAIPKEMIPLVDKPVVQNVVERVVDAGIDQIIFVTSPHKKAIKNHFDRNFDLEAKLLSSGKKEELQQIRKISKLAEFIYVEQKEARGNGDAILTAEKVVGDEPFFVTYPDEILDASPSLGSQLIKEYNRSGTIILAAIRSDDPDAADKYGYAAGREIQKGILDVEKVVEKPGKGNTPSDYVLVGGYIFTPDIFPALRKAGKKVEEGKELVWADGMNVALSEGKHARAVMIKDFKYYDCGSKIGYLQAVVEMALKDKRLGSEFRTYLKNLRLE